MGKPEKENDNKELIDFGKMFDREFSTVNTSDLLGFAKTLFDMYSALIKVGFDETKAFQIITTTVYASFGGKLR